MKLSKAQYDQIERIYQERSRRAREDARERTEAFYQAYPRAEELQREIISLYGEQFKATMDGDGARAAFLKTRREALMKEKQAQFMEAGISEEDLKPRYQCPFCQDTGWVEQKECDCRSKLVIREFYSDSVLWKRVQQEHFGNFSLDWYDNEKKLKAFQGRTCREVMAENLKAARAYVEDFEKNKSGVLLTGPVGTGKTFLCNCIAGALLKKGYSVLYFSAQEFFDQISAVLFRREDQDGLLTEQFGEADLLIVDDLGTEFTGQKLAANALFTILNERIIQKRGTLISTNLDLDELAERYSWPVASRLIGEFNTMRFTGGDIRLARRLK